MSDKKMGRPKKEYIMNTRITLRLDLESLQKLNNYCKVKNIDKSTALRYGIKKLDDDLKK